MEKERKRAIQTQVTVGVFAARIQQKHSVHQCSVLRMSVSCVYEASTTVYVFSLLFLWMAEHRIHTNFVHQRERENLFSIRSYFMKYILCWASTKLRVLLALSMKSLSIVRSIAYATHRTESRKTQRGNDIDILMRYRISIQSN